VRANAFGQTAAPERCGAQGIMCNHDVFQRTMEAERINQIASTISGLQQRTVDLRRYL